jgi:UDP-glucose 6-dehydrogenase
VDLIENKLGNLKGKAIAVLGLTYKPNTDVIEESSPVKISRSLLQKGAVVSVYDPGGMENAKKAFCQEKPVYASSIKDCLHDAELCVLATPWDEFKKLTPEYFIQNMKKPCLLDCWRLFSNRPEFTEKLDYFAIGLAA